MKKTCLIFILLLPFFCLAAKKENTKELELQQRIEALKKQYEKKLSELEVLTEKRWAARQTQVEVKEQRKEKLNQLQQNTERLYSDVARAREEFLARQRVLDREKEFVVRKETERDFLVQAVEGKKEKESQNNLVGFPLHQDTRMVELAKIDRTFSGTRYPAQKLRALIDYKHHELQTGSEFGIARRTFIIDGSSPVTAQVLRIGSCMAYAMTPDSDIYFLGNTGKMGRNRFEWSKITNPEMAAAIAGSFPDWIERRTISGTLPVDILQNKFSSSLVGGERRTWKTEVKEFFSAGGPILIPLALIILWALLIIINRIIVYALKNTRGHRFITEAITLLSKKEITKAEKLAKDKKGIHARVLQTCLKHSQWKRSAAEKSIKELLLTEIPTLDKHLDTLAVLAAIAPLMGLLGTVTGMIRMFEAITRFGTGDPKLLASGISEALITTEVGLSVAIPLLLIHNFLRNRRNRIQSEMEMSSMRILNCLWPEG